MSLSGGQENTYKTLSDLKDNNTPGSNPITLKSSGRGAVSIAWDAPEDYLTNAEDYLGFFILRKTEGEYATLDNYLWGSDYTADFVDCVYVGRGNCVGDPKNLDNTAAQIYSDKGLVVGRIYGYTVYVMKSDFTCFMWGYDTITVKDNATQLYFEDFTGASVSGGKVVSGKDSNGIGFDIGTATNVTIAEGHDDNSKSLKIQATGAGTTCTSDTLNLTNVEPNQIYHLTYWTRTTYSESTIDSKVDISSIGGKLTLPWPTGESQMLDLLSGERVKNSSCSVNDVNNRTGEIDHSPYVSNYFDESLNGIWVKRGITFVTPLYDNQSGPINLYGSETQTASMSLDQNQKTMSLQFTFEMPGVMYFSADTASISTQISSIELTKGISVDPEPYQNFYGASDVTNIVQNSSLEYDTNTEAVTTHYNTLKWCNAADHWTFQSGNFTYDTSAKMYYAAFNPTPGYPSILSQDIWYMSMNPNQKYTLSFDVQYQNSPPNLEIALLNSQGDKRCKIGTYDEGKGYSIQTSDVGDQWTWKSFSFDVTTSVRLSPTLQFTVGTEQDESNHWMIKNIKLETTNMNDIIGRQGVDMPYPIPTMPAYITDATKVSDYRKRIHFHDKINGNGDTPILQTLASGNGDTSNNSLPLYCLDQPGSNFKNLWFGANWGLNNCGKPGGDSYDLNFSACPDSKTGVLISTGEYFGSGVYQTYIKLEGPLDDSGLTMKDINLYFGLPYSFDFTNTEQAQTLLSPDFQKDALAKVEFPADCPVNSGDPNYHIANLTSTNGYLDPYSLHTMLPLDGTVEYNLYDGFVLTMVVHTGHDTDSPSDLSEVRTPGYIKWYVSLSNDGEVDLRNAVAWGGGWLGTNYGNDYIPVDAARMVLGVTYDGGNTTDWALLIMEEMSYMPLYSNGKSDQTNYMIPPQLNSDKSAVTKEAAAPNRDRYNPEWTGPRFNGIYTQGQPDSWARCDKSYDFISCPPVLKNQATDSLDSTVDLQTSQGQDAQSTKRPRRRRKGR